MLEEFQKRNEQTQFDVDFSELKKLLKNPLTLWKFMGGRLWEAEDDFFCTHLRSVNVGMPPKATLPLVRLGWGSGLLGTTVDMLLDESDVQRIRDTLFLPRYGTPAPKSRRLAARQGNAYLPLGWAKVKVVP